MIPTSGISSRQGGGIDQREVLGESSRGLKWRGCQTIICVVHNGRASAKAIYDQSCFSNQLFLRSNFLRFLKVSVLKHSGKKLYVTKDAHSLGRQHCFSLEGPYNIFPNKIDLGKVLYFSCDEGSILIKDFNFKMEQQIRWVEGISWLIYQLLKNSRSA